MFAQETGRNITGAAYRFKEVRALFRSALEYMSAVGELAFLQELASPAPLSRGPQAPPPRPSGGGGGGRSVVASGQAKLLSQATEGGGRWRGGA